MNDLKPHKHGQEGTHGACQEMLDKHGGKTKCCHCTGHKCKKRRLMLCSVCNTMKNIEEGDVCARCRNLTPSISMGLEDKEMDWLSTGVIIKIGKKLWLVVPEDGEENDIEEELKQAIASAVKKEQVRIHDGFWRELSKRTYANEVGNELDISNCLRFEKGESWETIWLNIVQKLK